MPQRAPLSLACLVVTEAQGISTHAASDPSLPSFWAVQRRERAFLPPSEKPVLDLAFQSWGRVRIRIRKSWPYTFFRTRTGSKGPVCMASPHLLPHLAVCHGQSDTAVTTSAHCSLCELGRRARFNPDNRLILIRLRAHMFWWCKTPEANR